MPAEVSIRVMGFARAWHIRVPHNIIRTYKAYTKYICTRTTAVLVYTPSIMFMCCHITLCIRYTAVLIGSAATTYSSTPYQQVTFVRLLLCRFFFLGESSTCMYVYVRTTPRMCTIVIVPAVGSCTTWMLLYQVPSAPIKSYLEVFNNNNTKWL